MSEAEPKKRIVLPVSRWHSDNLGDLLADGTVHIDDVCDRAVGKLTPEEERRRFEESEREFEEWLENNEPRSKVADVEEDDF